MATYYPSSSAQTDVFSAPYGNMMMYLNPASSTGSFSEISPGSSMNPQNRMEIPSMGARNEMMFIPPTGGDPMSMQTLSGHLNTGATDTISSSIPREQNLQGLSLSLSTQMSTPSFQFQYSNPGLSSVLSPHLPLSAENSVRQMACKVDETSPSNKDNMRSADYFSYHMQGDGSNPQYPMIMKTMNCNPYHYEQTGVAGNVLKSKYLKAAQELLDEVVNVRDALKKTQSEKEQSLNKMDEGSKESRGGSQPVSETNESAPGSGPSQELSPAERQELQSKLDKLHSMLDEVDRRYKQYCHQMQLLASSFDVVAGNGAAKPYTALALKTISRHFRCLRDAITNQIQSTRKSLGEQDNGLGVIPRLRYVDQQLRQQRALQQFGMMRHSWRPQRGLPENAVTILRAWLFEHFLHPYPKDSEKIMLARQTGLTRSQVANWFINARVRLWKPMIEEMYKEEFGEDVDINSKSSQENTPTPKLARYKSWGSEERREEMLETTTTSMTHEPHDSKTGPNPGLDIKGLTSSTPGLHIGSLGNNDNNPGHCTHGSIPADPNATGHLMVNTYQMPELGNFGVGNNQVSLALGLRHCEGDAMPMTSTAGETTMGVGVGNSEYPYLEQVNQQHRFGNPHILNDFVA